MMRLYVNPRILRLMPRFETSCAAGAPLLMSLNAASEYTVGKPSYASGWHAYLVSEQAYIALDEKVSQQGVLTFFPGVFGSSSLCVKTLA